MIEFNAYERGGDERCGFSVIFLEHENDYVTHANELGFIYQAPDGVYIFVSQETSFDRETLIKIADKLYSLN